MQHPITVKFWGVRGTIPTPGTANQRYGGHTSCVEITCGGHTIVMDAGTGLYPMGEQLKARDFDIFLSHTHLDHIMGFPFLSQAYDSKANVRVWAGHLKPELTLEDTLRRVVSPPIFPLTLEDMKAKLSFHDFKAGEEIKSKHFEQAGIRVRTLPLNHPDRATAYRIEHGGCSVCYVTDVEHRSDEMDASLTRFLKNADLFIYDSTFDDADFQKYKGWGHSTWQHAIRLGEAAQVGSVVLFHHDPGSDDATLDSRAKLAEKMRSGTVVAREGLVIRLPQQMQKAAGL